MLASANTHFFVAELENEITGMISIATYNSISGTKFWIEDVVIDESQRGKGLGRELMLFAIGYAESLGAGSIMLTSRPSRVAANKLYVELGFERYETNVYKLTIPTIIWATPQPPQRGG
jgi:ribosomal protein S18 acetylase RimI-like enzyme